MLAFGLATIVVAGAAPHETLAQKSVAKAEAPKTDAAAAKTEALEAARRRVRRAFDVVDELSDRARTLEVGTRVPILACLADAVWPYDAERASKIARVAFDGADGDVHEALPERWNAVRGKRDQVVTVVRRHDRALAKILAERLARDIPPADPNGGADEPEDVAKLLLAAQELAPDDPDAAAALVRRALATGVVPIQLPDVLRALSLSAPALVDPLVASVIANLRARGESPQDYRYLAIAGVTDERGEWHLDAEHVDAELARAYLEAEFAYLAAVASADPGLDRSRAPQVYGDALWLVPFVDQFDPARSGDMRAVVTRLRTVVPEELAAAVDAENANDVQSWSEHMGAYGAGDASSNLQDELEHDSGLWLAADDAAERGDGAKARDLASKIRDDDRRRGAVDMIAAAGMERAELEGRYDDVSRLASEISDPIQRAYDLADLADAEQAAGRRERALDLYGDMYRRLTAGGTMVPSDGVHPLMSYARALVPTDPQHAFSVLTDATGASNRSEGVGNCRELCSGCSNPFVDTYAVFAVVDFDRAVYVARSLDDPYERHYALLGAALGTLREDTKLLAAETEKEKSAPRRP